MKAQDLIYDWSTTELRTSRPVKPCTTFPSLFDETLRDGIQSPGVTNPSTHEKFDLLDQMNEIGIEAADLGFPGASRNAFLQSVAMVRRIKNHRLNVLPAFAARTLMTDIQPVIDIGQITGIICECYMFVGVSPIRQYVEGWSIKNILTNIRKSVQACKNKPVRVVVVLEDTTRSHPENLAKIFDLLIDLEVPRLTLCDTVGAATPHGTSKLIEWTQQYFEQNDTEIKLDWHGHNDRGLALANALAAIAAGCDRIHGTFLGIGERAGNTAIDQLLINYQLMGCARYKLEHLNDICQSVADYMNVPISKNYPALGADAFRTSSGVHAAAILKAEKIGDNQVKDLVYSAVPASMLGRKQSVEISYSSGESNVAYWLGQRGIEATPEKVKKILQAAKQNSQPLSDTNIMQLLRNVS